MCMLLVDMIAREEFAKNQQHAYISKPNADDHPFQHDNMKKEKG